MDTQAAISRKKKLNRRKLESDDDDDEDFGTRLNNQASVEASGNPDNVAAAADTEA